MTSTSERLTSQREYERLIKEREKLTARAFELSSRMAELREEFDKRKAEELELHKGAGDREGALPEEGVSDGVEIEQLCYN